MNWNRLVEYALIVGLIAVAIVAIILTFEPALHHAYEQQKQFLEQEKDQKPGPSDE